MAQITPRKRIWGWMMFDWAAQPFSTLLMTFIFAPYFATVVGDPTRAQALWGLGLTVSGLAIAICAPILGAIADTSGRRLSWIAVFSVLYVAGAGALWWAAPELGGSYWILAAFGIGLFGMEFATIFTNAMLPDLGPKGEIGRISGTGWAWGYVGGVLALIIMLLFFAENDTGKTLIGLDPALGLDPAEREGTRAVGPFTALWYAVFMIPFFLWVRPQPGIKRDSVATATIRSSLRDLGRTLRSLPARRSLSTYLVSSMLYRDALNGMYTFGGIYALGVLGWSVVDVGVFGILGAVSGALCAWAGGYADRAYGPKPVLVTCIALLLAVACVLVSISQTTVLGLTVAEGSPLPGIVFYACGAAIGGAGGVLGAASRTMLVRQADRSRMTEAFGLYALAGRATAFLAPMLIGTITALSDSQRMGIVPLIALFGIGLLLLRWVKPDGDRAVQWSDS